MNGCLLLPTTPSMIRSPFGPLLKPFRNGGEASVSLPEATKSSGRSTLPAATKQKLYRGKDDDLQRVEQRLRELVAAGWFLPEYVDAVLADARAVQFP